MWIWFKASLSKMAQLQLFPSSVRSSFSVPVFPFCVLKFYRFQIAHLRRFRACWRCAIQVNCIYAKVNQCQGKVCVRGMISCGGRQFIPQNHVFNLPQLFGNPSSKKILNDPIFFSEGSPYQTCLPAQILFSSWSCFREAII